MRTLPHRFRVCLSVLAIVLAIFTTACATPDTAGPVVQHWPEAAQHPSDRLSTPEGVAPEGWDEPARSRSGADSGIFGLAYRFYSRGLTQVDGARCEHRPTCSRYAYEAIQERGLLLGSFLTVDRLMRGDRSSVLRRLPIYRIHEGTMYYYDPVEANDFFL